VKISVPISGFDIVYKGKPDDILIGLQQRLAKLGQPAFIDAAEGNQIVINLHRTLAPDVAVANTPPATPRVPTPTPANPVPPGNPIDPTSPSTPVVTPEPPAIVRTPATPDKQPPSVRDPQPLKPMPTGGGPRLDHVVQKAQQSVSVVGIMLPDGQYFPMGTAWTVGKKTLATNAHVVNGLQEIFTEHPNLKGKAKIVAKRGPRLDKEMVIGEMKVHPGYTAWNRV
jgi:hypothetical protein